MDAQRVVDTALCFDVAIFGGYLRDVVVAGDTTFNDIDIMWPVGTHRSLPIFVRLLGLNGAKVTTKMYRNVTKYHGHDLLKIIVNDSILVDCVIYPGKLIDWLMEQDVDFTCNLFYRTREVPLGIRYIPESLQFDPNPSLLIMNLTKEKKFRTILDKHGDKLWVRAANRAYYLADRGWILDGQLISHEYESRLEEGFSTVMRKIDMIENRMKNVAMNVLEESDLTPSCKDLVRRKLFESDSDDAASTQVSETEDA